MHFMQNETFAQPALERTTGRSQKQGRATPAESPTSVDTVDSFFAEEMYPFMALLHGRERHHMEGQDLRNPTQSEGEAVVPASAAAASTVPDARIVLERSISAVVGRLHR